MTNIILSSIISGLAYADLNLNENLNQSKIIYKNDFAYLGAVNWGNSYFSHQYFENVKIKQVYHTSHSLDAYIFADYNSNKIYVAFRGTQETLDHAENSSLLFGNIGEQTAYVPTIVADAYALQASLGWTGAITATGHSLGGHLARTFSQVATNQGKNVKCTVFNTPIPTNEIGTNNDVMIYSDPSKWDATAANVHNAMNDSTGATSLILTGAAGHGIVSAIEALSGGNQAMTIDEYVSHYRTKMVNGTIFGDEFGKATTFLDRVKAHWEGRVPDVIDKFKAAFMFYSYKVNVDGHYEQDGFSEVFTQIVAGNNFERISVKSGSHEDRFDLGLGGVSFNGGANNDTASYKGLTNGIVVSEVNGPLFSGASVAINDVLFTDELTSVERLEATQGDDLITSVGFTQIWGFDGNDTIIGGTQDEHLRGGNGNDVLNGADGRDLIFADAGNDVLNGGDGDDDSLRYQDATSSVIWTPTSFGDGFGGQDTISQFEVVTGSSHDDVFLLTATSGVRMLYGGAGNDTLIGDGGHGYFYGGDGNDVLEGGGGQDEMNGSGGADQFVFRPGCSNDFIRDFEGAGAAAGDTICLIGFASYRFVEQGGGSTNSVLELDVNGDGEIDNKIRLTDGTVSASAYTADDVLFI